MPRQLTAEDARQSLSAHAAARGAELHQKYGPHIGWEQLQAILADRDCVRYPTSIEFDATSLLPGEFAHPVPLGAKPEVGFRLVVHPHFQARLEDAACLALYQLAAVNYGKFAGPENAEAFGAAALGISRDDYYARICELADELAGVAGA